MRRYAKNPIITRESVFSELDELRDVSSVFNPGAVIFENKVLLLLRVQNRGRETLLVRALSDNGIDFVVDQEPVKMINLPQQEDLKIYHIYDPRITMIENTYYVLCAMDTNQGCYLIQYQTEDFRTLHCMGIVSEADVRNGVLFPEKINNRYCRLERPNQTLLQNGPKSGSSIYLSYSDDLLHWQRDSLLFSGRPHFWDELIGSGPPPLKSRHGWIHLYHGVATHFASSNIYQAGFSLLDLHDPTKVLKRGRFNILEPRELYELAGQVPNVVFPSGMISFDIDDEGFLKEDAEILVYYGAADTCVALAYLRLNEILEERSL